jgi:hypothetical protein
MYLMPIGRDDLVVEERGIFRTFMFWLVLLRWIDIQAVRPTCWGSPAFLFPPPED